MNKDSENFDESQRGVVYHFDFRCAQLQHIADMSLVAHFFVPPKKWAKERRAKSQRTSKAGAS
jgi:hypothetical protein